MNFFTVKNVIGFLIIITLISGVIVGVRLVQQQTQLKSKAAPGNCPVVDLKPDETPPGYKWEAQCKRYCSNDTACKTSDTDTNKYWCYGFEDGAQCLKLVPTENVGVGSSPTTPASAPTPTSCNSISLSKSQATPGELINVTLNSSTSSYNTIYALPSTSLLASQIGTGTFLVTAPPTPGAYQIVVNTYTNDCSYFCDRTGHWKRNTSLNAGGGCPATTWEDIGECTNSCQATLTVVTPPAPPSVNPPPGNQGSGTNGPACTVDLKANGSNGPVTVDNNATVTLSWTSQNADRVIATGAWEGSKSTSGSEITSPLSGPGSSTFSLKCYRNNSDQTSTDSVQVTVRGAGGAPVVSTSPSPSSSAAPSGAPTVGSRCDYDILDRDGKSVKAGPIYENDRYTFKITMTNTGRAGQSGDWTKSTQWLQALGNTASLWGIAQRHELPQDRVSKDASAVFNIDATARPLSTLDKNFEDRPTSFSMAETGTGPFGATCPAEVRVLRKPAGLVATKCYVISENPNEVNSVLSCDDPLAKQYTTNPTVINYTFRDQSPGQKFIFVKFFDVNNRPSNTISKIVTYSPNPAISNVDCAYDSGAGLTTTYNITGIGFGLRNVNSKLRVGNQNATILRWGAAEIIAQVNQRVEGNTPVQVALEDGRSADGSCTVGTTTATLSVRNQCLSGQFDIDNVEVKIFSNVAEPFVRQTIKTDKDGDAQGFMPKLERNKRYTMIVKAPSTLAKKVVFTTTSGTSAVGPIVLPAGNIAPSPVADNIINSFDVNALFSQWSLTKDVSRPADLNRDGRVNSIDYACMKLNFNQQDEVFTQPVVVSPSSNTTTNNKKPIHLYPAYGADPKIKINNIHIISLLFIPKNISTPIKNEWLSNMQKTDSKIKGFFEKQFQNNIEITYQVVSNPVVGSKNIEDYTPTSLAQEAKDITSGLAKTGAYNVWMVYLVRDPEYKQNLQGGNLGGYPTMQAAMQYEYWLDDEAINSKIQYGLKGSAHEFAHALGIPHPWEVPANTTGDPNFGKVPEDLMGYVDNSVDFDQLYIRDDVKKEMGL